jgi:hypothetical protein
MPESDFIFNLNYAKPNEKIRRAAGTSIK